MKADRKSLGIPVGRLVSAAAGAALLGLAAAVLEARAAASAADLGFATAFVAAAGLLAPLALVLGLAVGVARVALLPPSFSSSLRRVLAGEAGHGARSAVFLLAPLALVLQLIVSARWALFVLSSQLPAKPAGAVLSLGVVASGACCAVLVAGVARATSARGVALPAPGVCLALSSLAAALVLVALVALGEPSGGASVWSQFGVLRREELDLRPVALVGTIALAAAIAPIPTRRGALLPAVALAVAPLGFTVRAATVLDSPGVALAFERNAPLAARVLVPLRRLSDRDGDGFASRFGGGDCDDSDPEVNPEAIDTPGNGRDEDCSGSDAKPRAPAAPVESVPADARAAAVEKLPANLNVVLITIDTLRYDVGYMGYSRPITPRIDELAKESVVFERAYALASYTAKSLPPMLIGKYSGETHRGYSHFNRFEAAETFVAQRLQRAGIRTISVQGYWYFFQPFGMERGFDVINSTAAPKTPQLEGDRGSTSAALSDAAIRELSDPNLEQQRFFLWVHYTDPHAEYVQHEGFEFGKDSRARYDSEVAFVDHHVGRILDALRKSPLWERTAVVLTSDHGEAFGEHGMIRHGFELWEELVRVPLLVRVPGFAPRRIAARRSLIDLVPTLLDLYGVPQPTGEGSDFVSGRSLIVDLASPPGHTPEERPIYIDMAEGPHNQERRAYIENDLKLTTSGGRPLGLYDLASDPGETKDLSRDRARLSEALERFKAFEATLRPVRVRRPRRE